MTSYIFSRIEENEDPNWRGGIGATRAVYKFKILHVNILTVEELREEIKDRIEEDEEDRYEPGIWSVTKIESGGIRESPIRIEVL